MSRVDGRIGCGAWLEVSTAEGRRRTCVLRAGHYLEAGPGDLSWHTNCPDAEEKDHPLNDHGFLSGDHEDCTVWSDNAKGARPSDVTVSKPDEPEMTFMESVIRAASDEPVLEPVELPTYTAEIIFRTSDGDRVVSATLYGPAEFLATATAVIGEEFQKEVER